MAAIYALRFPLYVVLSRPWSESAARPAAGHSAIEAPNIEADALYVYDSYPYPRAEITNPRFQLDGVESPALSGRTPVETAANRAKAYLRAIAPEIGLAPFEGLREMSVSAGAPPYNFVVVLQRTVDGIDVEGATAIVTIGPKDEVTEVIVDLVRLDDSVALITSKSGLSESAIVQRMAWLTGWTPESMWCERYVSAKAPHLRWRVRFGLEVVTVDAITGAFVGYKMMPAFLPWK
jgi:hypothetical protein